MSFDVSLMGEDGPVEVESHSEGGTHALGGTSDAVLNVTYNYSWFYYKFLNPDGLRWLDGKQAQETVESLESAVVNLGTKTYKDYWAPTPGNAGHALNVLLGWAKQHPDGVWHVS